MPLVVAVSPFRCRMWSMHDRLEDHLAEGWGLELSEALDGVEKRQAIVRKARALALHSPRPPAREVYRQLLAAISPGRNPKPPAHDEVSWDANGAAA